MKGNLLFNIVGSKFTVFALGLYLEGRFKGGFLHYWIGDLVFGGAYTWRGLFSEFYSICCLYKIIQCCMDYYLSFL